MRMNKEQLATGAAAAAAFATGLFFDPSIAGVIFGVGGNLIANILQWGAGTVSGRLGKAWMSNHDIRNALKEAFAHAVEKLEADYREDYPLAPKTDQSK